MSCVFVIFVLYLCSVLLYLYTNVHTYTYMYTYTHAHTFSYTQIFECKYLCFILFILLLLLGGCVFCFCLSAPAFSFDLFSCIVRTFTLLFHQIASLCAAPDSAGRRRAADADLPAHNGGGCFAGVSGVSHDRLCVLHPAGAFVL